MGDGNALKAGAEAHHKAIGSIDGSGVTSASDYEAVNNAIGHMVASVPTSKVMDVYNAWAGGGQGVLRVQGRGEGGAALSEAGERMARLFFVFLKPGGSFKLPGTGRGK